MVNIQLNDFLQEANILHPKQSGFRPGHSTESVLLHTTETLKFALDQGMDAVLILLDLSAAFDTFSPDILGDSLANSGITHKALAWLTSFLKDRRQMVTLGSYNSTEKHLPSGVPQGSSLSPTLFNLYMLPLLTLIASFDIESISYADDTQLILTLDKKSTAAEEKCCHCPAAVMDWMKLHHLKYHVWTIVTVCTRCQKSCSEKITSGPERRSQTGSQTT